MKEQSVKNIISNDRCSMYKVRENKSVKSKVVNISIGVDSKAYKNVLMFMISDSEAVDR